MMTGKSISTLPTMRHATCFRPRLPSHHLKRGKHAAPEPGMGEPRPSNEVAGIVTNFRPTQKHFYGTTGRLTNYSHDDRSIFCRTVSRSRV